jgi:hypothetical protein
MRKNSLSKSLVKKQARVEISEKRGVEVPLRVLKNFSLIGRLLKEWVHRNVLEILGPRSEFRFRQRGVDGHIVSYQIEVGDRYISFRRFDGEKTVHLLKLDLFINVENLEVNGVDFGEMTFDMFLSQVQELLDLLRAAVECAEVEAARVMQVFREDERFAVERAEIFEERMDSATGGYCSGRKKDGD